VIARRRICSCLVKFKLNLLPKIDRVVKPIPRFVSIKQPAFQRSIRIQEIEVMFRRKVMGVFLLSSFLLPTLVFGQTTASVGAKTAAGTRAYDERFMRLRKRRSIGSATRG
jgi:hypothetical protein